MAGCSAEDGGGASADDGTDSRGENVAQLVRALKLCDLVDLDPLVQDAMSGEYRNGPVSVPYGSGTDPGSVGCNAQIHLPTIETGGKPMRGSGNVITAVPPYPSVDEAAQAFDERFYEGTVKRLEGIGLELSEPKELEGAWDQALMVSDTTGGVWALAQQDSYLIKIEIVYDSDAQADKGYPFTTEDVRAATTELLAEMHEAVAAELDRQR